MCSNTKSPRDTCPPCWNHHSDRYQHREKAIRKDVKKSSTDPSFRPQNGRLLCFVPVTRGRRFWKQAPVCVWQSSCSQTVYGCAAMEAHSVKVDSSRWINYSFGGSLLKCIFHFFLLPWNIIASNKPRGQRGIYKLDLQSYNLSPMLF